MENTKYNLENSQITEEQAKRRKACAILAVKYANVQVDSLAYWIALADAEQDLSQQDLAQQMEN